MNRSCFEIRGLNQERELNSLSKEVKLYKVKRLEYNKTTFEVARKNEKQVFDILSTSNLEITFLGHRGLKNFVKKFCSSVGLVVGILTSLIFYILQYGVIMKIEVCGNSEVSTAEIVNYTNSILASRIKSEINEREIEDKIKSNFKLVSSISVAIVGQTLVINLNEGNLPIEMEGEFLPIVSEADCLITKIDLIQGTINVKVGDIVKKGEILVYPYIIDSEGERRNVQPKAEIEADVWLKGEYCHNDHVVKIQRTGKVAVVNRVLLFEKEIYKYSEENKFSIFEEETECRYLVESNTLPFKLERKIYYEMEKVEIFQPFEENKTEIIELARKNVLIFLKKNEIIKEEKYFVREGGGCHFIDYFITVSRNIGG